MTLRSVSAVHPKEIRDVLAELQRLKITVVAGAAADTKMAVAAMRAEDTILSVMTVADAAGSVNTPTDDTANCSISDIKATGTITISGDPVADETVTVNGQAYTWKAAPTAITHVKIVTGDNTAMAVNLKNAINGHENRRLTTKWNVPDVVATSALGVVTVTAVLEGADGNAFTLSEASTNVAVSGATLSGGSDTGGFQSDTNNSSRTCTVFWYDKN